ncbi:hypothetical protein BAC3_01282 [uncultured bacterium]|nr:hypothetical protein BAC3_01282 [uncultured bacterium]
MELIAFGERYIYLISENSNQGSNIIGSSSDLAFENQKLHLVISHKDELINFKDELINQLKQENGYLKSKLENKDY